MARLIYFVLTEAEHKYIQDGDFGGKYLLPTDFMNRTSGIFTSRKDAERYAISMAQQNPGIDVSIFIQDNTYWCKPEEPVKKKWNHTTKTLEPAK